MIRRTTCTLYKFEGEGKKIKGASHQSFCRWGWRCKSARSQLQMCRQFGPTGMRLAGICCLQQVSATWWWKNKKQGEESSRSNFDFNRVNNDRVAGRSHFHKVCASCAWARKRASAASPLCLLESWLRHGTALRGYRKKETDREVNKPARGLTRGF